MESPHDRLRSLVKEKILNILVTGGSGFLGTELVKLLRAMDHYVINVDLVSSGLGTEFVHDLTTGSLEIEADFCFHLASAAGGLLFNQKKDVLEYNAKMNDNVLAICGSMPIVFVSTLNVFEGAQSIKDVLLKPSTPYAKSKLQGEQFFVENAHDLVIVRPCNIFGKSQINTFSQYGESHVIPDILHKIQNCDSHIEAWGDGSQKRGFLHVIDTARFLASLLDGKSKLERNICSSLILSISDLINELIKFSGKMVEVRYNDSYMKYENMFIENIKNNLEYIGTFDSISEGLLE